MLAGPLVFFDIDTQRDFLEAGGALFIRGGEAILPQLARLTEFARLAKIPVLATACAHVEDDPEFEVFPPHCLVGTPGQQRVEATSWPQTQVLGVNERIGEAIPSHLTVEKVSHDFFSRADAIEIVTHYARNDPTFVVYGVATDYCVGCAVRGLVNQGLRVALVVDAIRAIVPEQEARILTEFAKCGVLLTLTDVVCDDHSHARPIQEAISADPRPERSPSPSDRC